jgi:hypothetical protein
MNLNPSLDPVLILMTCMLECGVDDSASDGLLQSTVFKNRSLVSVNGVKTEYMRRDVVMTL